MKKNIFIVSGAVVSSTKESRFLLIDDEIESDGYLLMFDLSLKAIFSTQFWATPRRRRFLFLVEPSCVLPHQYWGIWKAFFNKIASPTSKDNRWQAGYCSDQDLASLGNLWGNEERSSRPAAIVSDKYGFPTQCNYALRRRIYAKIAASTYGMRVAGRGWLEKRDLISVAKSLLLTLFSFKMPVPRTDVLSSIYYSRQNPAIEFLSEQDSAREFLRTSSIAVVVENETGTYCSEKLSDAVLSGCKIAYVGGRLSRSFAESYPIECFSCPEDVMKALESLTGRQQPRASDKKVVHAAQAQLTEMSLNIMAKRAAQIIVSGPR